MEVQKFCTVCKEFKPLTEFWLKPNGKYHSWCYSCRKIRKKEWDEANKEHRKDYRSKNKERIDKREAEYRLSHKDELRIKSALYNEISNEYIK